MKLVPTAVFVGALLAPAFAYADYKYQEGDCITPTNESWSWHKRFARVGGVFERKDADYNAGNLVYQLHVMTGHGPWEYFQRNNPMFDLELIEANTEKVPDWLCGLDQSG
jgi:hypothetical protein